MGPLVGQAVGSGCDVIMAADDIIDDVITTPAKATGPVVYPLVPCDCQDGAEVSVACLATDFFPQPATVSWSSSSGSTTPGQQETFPVLPVTNGYFALISQLTIPPDQLDQSFQCQVTHSPTGTKSQTIEEPCPPKTPPELKLLGDPNKYEEDQQVLLMCLVEGLKAGEAKVTWMINHEEKNLQAVVTSCDQCSGDKATLTSQVNVSRQSWDNGAEFSCKVTHPYLEKAEVLNISTFCSGGPPAVTVTLLPPSLEDLYLNQNGSVTCVATNLKDPEEVKFSWTRDRGEVTDVTTGKPEKLENGLYLLSSTLKICAEEWNSGETFSCTLRSPQLEEPVTKSIKKEIASTTKAPSVYVFPPAPEELAHQEVATLTCLATGFLPEAILMTWTQEDQPVASTSILTFPPQRGEDGTWTTYSSLRTTVAAWQRGDTFACLVAHEGIPLRFLQKNLDKSLGRATNLNVSVVLADADVTCY